MRIGIKLNVLLDQKTEVSMLKKSPRINVYIIDFKYNIQI